MSEPKPATPIKPTTPVKARVLVVDDEPNLRKVLGALLRQQGYEVHAETEFTGALAGKFAKLADMSAALASTLKVAVLFAALVSLSALLRVWAPRFDGFDAFSFAREDLMPGHGPTQGFGMKSCSKRPTA